MIEPTSNLGTGDSPELEESWKDEIASRLDHYRSKSKKKLSGDFSMRFDFDGEPARPRQQVCVPAPPEIETYPEQTEPAAEPVLEPVEQTEQAPQQQVVEVNDQPEHLELPQTVPPTQPVLRPSVPFRRKIRMEANVIEFPRLFPPEPSVTNVLAEPVLPSRPRILDAPEIGEPLLENPMLDGMRLEKLESEPAHILELPLQVAPLPQRAYATASDLLIVAVAVTIFSTVTWKLLPGVEWSKPMIGAIAAVPVVLWGFYQYLFVVYGARTPGMALAQLAFSTFEGTAPNLRQRRSRVLAMALSCSALMLGVLWAFFDEDTLCWHDRISHTYSYHQKP